MKIAVARNDPAGGIRQPPVAARPHRRGPHRARRDLHGAGDGRGLCPRGDRAEGDRARSARRSIASPATSTAISGSARPAPRRAAIRRSTSRSGTCSARSTGQPIAQLLGGFSRDRIRTYNTCAGSAYMRRDAGQSTANWGLSARRRDYDDLNGFLHRADELAAGPPRREGITAMKIWPFDLAAEATDGARHLRRRSRRRRWSRSRRSARRSATGWRSWSSSIRCGSSCPRCASPGRSRRSTRSGTRTRSRWTASASLRRYAEVSPAPICASETLGSALGLPRSSRDRRRRRRHARSLLVRRPVGGAEDRGDGRSLAPAGRAARLHRAGRAVRLDPPVAERAERADPGERARLLPDLVPRSRHRAAGGPRRLSSRFRAGPGLGMELAPDITKRFAATVRVSKAE